jgi:K+-transporting ATPase A subunit
MGLVINQYSFLLIAAALTLVAGLVLLSNKPKWSDYLAFGVIVISLIMAWIIMHPRQTPLMDDAKMVKEMIGAGKPVLLEFQSPY